VITIIIHEQNIICRGVILPVIKIMGSGLMKKKIKTALYDECVLIAHVKILFNKRHILV